MVSVEVSIDIDSPRARVWDDVSDIASHVTWMVDAAEIRFVTARTAGVGTRFECDTRVGPLRTTDVMEVTAWDDQERIGVRHDGLVTGDGQFMLEELDGERTRFIWREDLTFPRWFGGPIGAAAARPLFRLIWRRNLGALRARLEAGTPGRI